MKTQRKFWIPIAIAVAAALALVLLIVESVGGGLDVVATKSAAAFDRLLTALPQKTQTDATTGAWALSAPDGSARFLWAKGVDAPFAIALEWDAQPFVDAGLDATKLPENYTLQSGRLTIALNAGNRTGENLAEATPLESFQRIVNQQPALLGYHMNVGAVNYLSDDTLVKYANIAYEKYGADVGTKHIALMKQFKAAAETYGTPMGAMVSVGDAG